MTARPLVAPAVSAEASGVGRWPFAFAPRFFTLVAIGAVLLVPAWIDRRAAIGLVAWNLLVVSVWMLDVWRLPAPGQLTVTRAWPGALTIGRPGSVAVELVNTGGILVKASVVDAVAASLRRDLPEIDLQLPAGEAGRGQYDIEPRERGLVPMGAIYVRYRSGWGMKA